MRLFDTHAHLYEESFDDTRDAVVQRAVDSGIENILCVGVTGETSRRCVALANRYPSVFASAGIQPNYVAEIPANDWDTIVALTNDPRVVALGETGLDRYWDNTPFALQKDYFDRHLRLSQSTGLPFIVHMRECETDVLEMLRVARQRGTLNGVMHSFTGTMDGMRECVELGLFISFAGMVTFKKSDDLRAIAAAVPADRILIETDSPYLAPHPFRGQRPNEPSWLVHTATCLASVRGESAAAFAETCTRNARGLFLENAARRNS